MVSLVPLILIAHNIIYRTMNYYIFIKNMNLNLILFNPMNRVVGMMALSWHLTTKQTNKQTTSIMVILAKISQKFFKN